MVTRNELERYLPAVILWLREITDVQHIYDDRSTDGTFEHLQQLGVPVDQRSVIDQSFATDESAFRARAWRLMEERHNPSADDWILCVDADEFVTARAPADTHEFLTEAIERHMSVGAVTLPVNEVFDFDHDHTPLLRVDGYWGQIQACRLVRWRPAGRFPPRVEGGGSVPAGWASSAQVCTDLAIMHLGYARPSDRQAKHARYSATTGHNPRHITSILEPPTLKRWDGPLMSWPETGPRS
jgi:hypothetical protein